MLSWSGESLDGGRKLGDNAALMVSYLLEAPVYLRQSELRQLPLNPFP